MGAQDTEGLRADHGGLQSGPRPGTGERQEGRALTSVWDPGPMTEPQLPLLGNGRRFRFRESLCELNRRAHSPVGMAQAQRGHRGVPALPPLSLRPKHRLQAGVQALGCLRQTQHRDLTAPGCPPTPVSSADVDSASHARGSRDGLFCHLSPRGVVVSGPRQREPVTGSLCLIMGCWPHPVLVAPSHRGAALSPSPPPG